MLGNLYYKLYTIIKVVILKRIIEKENPFG